MDSFQNKSAKLKGAHMFAWTLKKNFTVFGIFICPRFRRLVGTQDVEQNILCSLQVVEKFVDPYKL